MSENLHKIDKLFRDPIEEYEEMPSADVWDNLDKNLDKSNVININRKYSRLKKISAAMLILLIGTLIFELSTVNFLKNNTTISKSGPEKTATNSSNNLSPANSNKSETSNSLPGKDIKKTNGNYNSKKTEVNKKDTDNTDLSTGKQEQNYSFKKTKPVIANKNDFADQNTKQQKNGKSQIKKSTGHKILINTINGEIGELTPEASNENSSEGAGYAKQEPILKPLEKISPEKITAYLPDKKAIQFLINKPVIFLNTTSINSIAKNKNVVQHKFPGFSATLFFAPQFSFNRIENENHHDRPQPTQPPGEPRIDRDAIKKNEQHQTSSSFGVLLDLPLSQRWGLQSGVTLLNKNTSINPKTIYANLDNDGNVRYRFDCSSGYTYISSKTAAAPVVGDSANAAESSNKLQYLGIPLAVTYRFPLGRFSIVPTVGASANFLIKQKLETELLVGASKETQTITDIQGLKSSYFTAVTGISFEYALSKRIGFVLMPSGNFALSSITRDAAVKSYINSFSLAGAVKIKF